MQAAAIAAAAIAAAASLACGDRPSDDASRAADPSEPHSIVSLSPGITELLFALEVGDRVVGRTRWCQHPPEARLVPSVGDGLDPNVEAIVARQPDLVVFYRSPSNESAIRRLTGLGVPTLTLPLDRVHDLRNAALVLGERTGRVARAESLVTALDTQLVQAAPTVPSGRGVLLLVWDSPPIVIGAGSFLHEIVTLAGGRNVFGDEAAPSLTVSIETIVRRNPDVVLVTGSDTAFASRPEWGAVAAVRERRFVVVDGTAFSYPSFRVVDAVTQLRRALEGAVP